MSKNKLPEALRLAEAEVERLRAHINKQNVELDSLIPIAEKLEAEVEALQGMREEVLHYQREFHRLRSEVEALRAALHWIANVNAMDYEYQAKARAAIDKEQVMKTWHITVEDGPHQSYDIEVKAPTKAEAIALAREQELKKRPWLHIMISPAACWELDQDHE